VPPPMPAIAPTPTRVRPSATRQFTFVNFTGGAVTWSCLNGTMSSYGLYTAPSTPCVDTVSAVGVADGSQTASASVIVRVGSGHRWFPMRRR
jgi:hypothetical protein